MDPLSPPSGRSPRIVIVSPRESPPPSESPTTEDVELLQLSLTTGQDTRRQRLHRLTQQSRDETTSLEEDLHALNELREMRRDIWNELQREGDAVTVQGIDDDEVVQRTTTTDDRSNNHHHRVWRNEPVSIPRTSSLPRGGRVFPYTTSTVTTTTSTSPSVSNPSPSPSTPAPQSSNDPTTSTNRFPTADEYDPTRAIPFNSTTTFSTFNPPPLTSLLDSTPNPSNLFPPPPPPSSSIFSPIPSSSSSTSSIFVESNHRQRRNHQIFSPPPAVSLPREQPSIPRRRRTSSSTRRSVADAITTTMEEEEEGEVEGENGVARGQERGFVEGEGQGQQGWTIVLRPFGGELEGLNEAVTDVRDGRRGTGGEDLEEGEEEEESDRGWASQAFSVLRDLRRIANHDSDVEGGGGGRGGETINRRIERGTTLRDEGVVPSGRGTTTITSRRRVEGVPTTSNASHGHLSRTREETNAISGRTLRSKKKVWLVYCGGEAQGVGGDTTKGGSGCGSLICARGLTGEEGNPPKVFEDGGVELESVSTDLPPVEGRVADLQDDDEMGQGGSLGEKVGKRGWKGCRGCLTRDLGCRNCGKHIGYRLLRPDVICSISRPSLPSITTTVRRQNSSSLLLASGGVTGGGLVDGLLFHFKRDEVTCLERRVGIVPKGTLVEEEEERSRVFESRAEIEKVEEEGEESDRGGGSGARARKRLRERVPNVGDEMIWKHIPHPQLEFQDSLVSSPLDWVSPGIETWWLDHSISLHLYSIDEMERSNRLGLDSAGSGRRRKRRNEGDGEGFETDRLSSARTTVGARGDGEGRVGGETRTSPLSRSNAIRLRVPSSSSSPTSASTLTSTNPNTSSLNTTMNQYDRYRNDAQSFERRVRQRLSLGQSQGGGTGRGGVMTSEIDDGEGVARSLERVGYGSDWWTPRDEEDDLSFGGTSFGKRRRQSVGR